jgi:hypothetical protein
MKRLSLALSLAVSMLACGGSTPTTPTALVAPTRPTFTISGVISAMMPTGMTPLEGAGVFINGHRGSTNAEGFFSIAGVEVLPFGNSVTASRAGYGSETKSLTISGDTRVDFQLVRTAVDSLAGVVSEVTSTGRVPIAGVRVDVYSMPCDQRGTGCVGFGFPIEIFQSAMTDKSGVYRISGLYPGKYNVIWLSKQGFEDPFPPRPDASEGGQVVTIDGATLFDVQLLRR